MSQVASAQGADIVVYPSEIIKGTAPIALPFGSEVRDDANFWTNTNPTVVTIPVSGWYIVPIYINVDHTGGSNTYSVTSNGAELTRVMMSYVSVDKNDYPITLASLNWFSAGDQLKLMISYASSRGVYFNSAAATILSL
jgi:hypothetical protein